MKISFENYYVDIGSSRVKPETALMLGTYPGLNWLTQCQGDVLL